MSSQAKPGPGAAAPARPDDKCGGKLKVILVGPSGVGKTSLVGSFFNNPLEKQEQPTVAPSSCNAVIDLGHGKNVELQIWDTAGQERFQSISKMFYRGSNVALVCYNSDSEASIQKWISSIKIDAPKCEIFIVFTKSDLLSKEKLEESRVRGEEIARILNVKAHFITSSYTGSGVHDVFVEAAKCASLFNLENPMSLALSNREQKSSNVRCQC